MQKRNIIIIASLLVALAAAYFLGTQSTGLLVLPTEQEKQTEEPKQNENINSEFKLTSNARQVFAPELSFEEVKPTKLMTTIIDGKAKNCPEESTLKIQVQNIGANKAHRLFTEFQDFKAKECANCEQKEIQSQEIIEIFLTGCKESQNAYAWFYSVNAKKETIKIN